MLYALSGYIKMLLRCQSICPSQANPNACYAKDGEWSDVVIPFIHANHFVFPRAVLPSTPASAPRLAALFFGRRLRLRSRGRLAPKVDGSQFTPLACPHTQGSHDGRAAYL